MDWGCFKFDLNILLLQFYFDKKIGKEKKGLKYILFVRVLSRLVFLRIIYLIWEKISECYNVLILEEEKQYLGGFWYWVLFYLEILVIFGEGVKKVGCLLFFVYVGIFLFGIWMVW